MAINPDSEIGREFVSAGMQECVDTCMEDYGAGFGVASEYCRCALNDVVQNLSVEQIVRYYDYGYEIDKLMNVAAEKCLGVLLADPDSKKQYLSIMMEQCVEGAIDSGVGIGLASEYCKCVTKKIIDNMSVEQLMEYYNHGVEIEELQTECLMELMQE